VGDDAAEINTKAFGTIIAYPGSVALRGPVSPDEALWSRL
jgi:hypothetical protein